MTAEEFLKSKEPNTYIIPKEWLKEFAIEIAKKAFDEGFFHCNSGSTSTVLKKYEYIEKLKNEL